jgi:hypothetical protein
VTALRPICLAVLGAALIACQSSDLSASRGAAGGGGGGGGFTPPDAGIRRVSDASVAAPDAGLGVDDGGVIETDQVREEFDSRFFVDTSSAAVVDVNRGHVRLPIVELPEVEGPLAGEVSVQRYDGVVEAERIVVPAADAVEGSDAIELRASDSLVVEGQLRAGPGGVSLVAGRSLRITGLVESEGPIRIRLTGADGHLEITGRVATLGAVRRASAGITLIARGTIDVTGEILTGDAESANTGSIELRAYGPVVVDGRAAELRTGASVPGRSGAISLRTEASIEVRGGARLATGLATDPSSERPTVAVGGEILLEADSVRVGADSSLVAGDSPTGTAGAVSIRSTGALVVESSAELRGGGGSTGGAVELAVAGATFAGGARLEGGRGVLEAGRVFLDSAAAVRWQAGARARGGDGACAAGAPVVVLVGGTLSVETDVVLGGGDGGTDPGDGCLGGFAGGDVTLFARAVEGPLESSLAPGDGASVGVTAITVEAGYRREAPRLDDHPTGWVRSKVLDRGASAVGRIPRLVELRLVAPAGTRAEIQLAGEDAPDGSFDDWQSGRVDDAASFGDLRGHRYYRYRVWLEGRALDTPRVEGFELDLAGR